MDEIIRKMVEAGAEKIRQRDEAEAHQRDEENRKRIQKNRGEWKLVFEAVKRTVPEPLWKYLVPQIMDEILFQDEPGFLVYFRLDIPGLARVYFEIKRQGSSDRWEFVGAFRIPMKLWLASPYDGTTEYLVHWGEDLELFEDLEMALAFARSQWEKFEKLQEEADAKNAELKRERDRIPENPVVQPSDNGRTPGTEARVVTTPEEKLITALREFLRSEKISIGELDG